MKLLLNQKFGLGNQLFQYAAGLYYAERFRASLEIIREQEQTAVSHGHPRPFLLSKFCISTPVRERTWLDRVLRSSSPAIASMVAPVRSLLGAYNHDPQLIVVGEFQPTLPLTAGTRRVYLNGHFQAHQYAQHLEAQLRKEFGFREPPTGRNLEVLRQIKGCDCPVSLHLRRGDYTVDWKGINLLSMVYYNNAIGAMRALHPNATFFIFSDDIAAARAVLRPLDRAIFVDHNSEETAHEDLRLMSSCRHHILANSTFSWWGAWLNPDPAKMVLVPDPWHVSDPHPDLIPAGWHRIPSQERTR